MVAKQLGVDLHPVRGCVHAREQPAAPRPRPRTGLPTPRLLLPSLASVLRHLRLWQGELVAIFDMLDANNDGTISFEEFYKWWSNAGKGEFSSV